MQTTNHQVKKGSDVSKILHESMIRLRNICNALIDNLFEKIYHAPNSIRNICRVLVDILKQKVQKYFRDWHNIFRLVPEVTKEGATSYRGQVLLCTVAAPTVHIS